MTSRLAPSRSQPSRSQWLPVVALLAPAVAFLAAFTYWPVLRVFGESFIVGRFAGQHALGERPCLQGGLGQFLAKDLMPLALAHAGRLQKFGA